MAERELTAEEALNYLNDIAHGRKMKFDPQVLNNIVEKHLGDGKYAVKILKIIYDHPFAIEVLFHTGSLGKHAETRYMWSTISEEEFKELREFFADGKRD